MRIPVLLALVSSTGQLAEAGAQLPVGATRHPVVRLEGFAADPTSATHQEPAARHRYSFWLEGAALGAAIGGTTGAFIYYGLCESDCVPERALASAAVLGVLGAFAGTLMGAMVPSSRPRPFRGMPGAATLVGATAGAVWSFGVMNRACQGGCSGFEIRFGVATILAGGLTGYLMSRGNGP
jgi:hypothetical protein